MLPVHLETRNHDRLFIAWDDGRKMEIPFATLRKSCPCATCREQRNAPPAPAKSLGLPVLSLAEARPLVIESMRPVGNYAYGIAFSDGHDTGIFTLEFLRELGTDVEE